MRARWVLAILTVFAVCLPAFTLPIKPNPTELLEKELYNKKVYPPARVAWNGPETPRKPFNPVYEAMLYPRSGEAMRQSMADVAINPIVLLSIATIIVLLRTMRRKRHATRTKAEVVAMPGRVEEAA